MDFSETKDRTSQHFAPLPPLLRALDATGASVHMFTSGRPCLGRRLSVVLDTAAAGPEDPLLFLYPRWAASALQQRTIASLSSRTTPIKSNRDPSRPFRIPSSSSPYALPSPFAQQATRWSSTHVDSGTLDSSASEQPLLFKDDNAKPLKSKPRRDSSSPSHPGNRQSITRSELRERRRAGNVNAAQNRSQPPTSPNVSSGTRHGKLSARDKRNLRYGAHLRRISRVGFSPIASETWDDMEKMIEAVEKDSRTHPKKGLRTKELFVPEETVALLCGVINTTMKENIWFIHLRNGCKVHILHPSEGDGVNRKVVLTGSEHTMELVARKIRRFQTLQDNGDPLVDIKKPPMSMVSARSGVSKIRGVWDFGRTDSPSTLDEIVVPHSSLNTVKELTEYVEDLTNAHRSKSDDIASCLSALFQDDSLRHLFSTGALNRALQFLCSRNQLRVARVIFAEAQHVATIDSYNIFLRSAARQGNVLPFRRFLGMMPGAGIRPNADTWLALLEARTTPSAKAAVMTRMVKKGFMADIGVIRSALQLTIQDSLFAHLESGQSVDSFIALMNQTHGANWFNVSLLGQMFSVVARLKNFTAADELLDICAREGFVLDGTVFAQLLPMCKGSIHTALHYTNRFYKFPQFTLTPQAWERLFLIAFKSRKYNISRVLWRYACMKSSATYKMKQTVLSSLTRNASHTETTDSAKKLWDLNAAKLMVGIGRLHLQKTTFEELPSEFKQNPQLYLTSGYKDTEKGRALQLRVANDLIRSDMTAGVRYRPNVSLPLMLEAAAIIDKEWEGVPRPLHWQMQNAIQVTMKDKRKSLLSNL